MCSVSMLRSLMWHIEFINFQGLPIPFPIPAFRHTTEIHLQRGAITDTDQKYMVQTLTTLLMTYKTKPSLNDCLIVSRSLHEKFQSLGDESSEVCHTFCYNVATLLLFRVHGNGSFTHDHRMSIENPIMMTQAPPKRNQN